MKCFSFQLQNVSESKAEKNEVIHFDRDFPSKIYIAGMLQVQLQKCILIHGRPYTNTRYLSDTDQIHVLFYVKLGAMLRSKYFF